MGLADGLQGDEGEEGAAELLGRAITTQPGPAASTARFHRTAWCMAWAMIEPSRAKKMKVKEA
ncbi:hypothetical protein STANM309S_03785 [Streptomyces tanashiensis]